MPLTPGTRLGFYEIKFSIAADRARDIRLDRDVAIKVLPSALAGNPERLSPLE